MICSSLRSQTAPAPSDSSENEEELPFDTV